MGWISARKMRTGHGLCNHTGRKHSDKGPLRKVIGFKWRSDTMFAPDRAYLECGHEADSWGGVRARCRECKKTEDAGV